MSASVTRRFVVPPYGRFPLPVVTPSASVIRALVRNEGTGGNESEAGALPAPLYPFNFLGPPLTFPSTAAQSCLLSIEHNDPYSSPGTCYVLSDGASDIIVLAPHQGLYAVSGTGDVVTISVQLIYNVAID